MSPTTNAAWLLAARPEGAFKPSDFQWTESPIPSLTDGQVLVRQVYLSLDPASRGWAGPSPTYLPPVAIGSVMRGFGIGIVEESRFPGLASGDLVQGLLGWQSHPVMHGSLLRRMDRDPDLRLDAYMAVLSHIGATAYFGLLEVGALGTGETLVVSGAAGAVGSLVGQIGKIKGCRVVGIAGSDEKCAWLTDLGFDATINYKKERVLSRLRRLCPDGVDVHFENAGVASLDASLALITPHARVVLCGFIAQYNDVIPPPGPRFVGNLLTRRARMEGFVVVDYEHRFAEALDPLARWLKEGRLRYRTDIVDGLDRAPVAVNRLFEGTNTGKLLVRVSD
jgi:NADPH-dependent curcumin reductase